MKNMYVNLISHSPVDSAILAIQQPYANENATLETFKKVLLVNKHESIAEHVWMTFEIGGVSRLELQEHMRHRIASPTVQSTRFTLGKMLENTSTCLPEYFQEYFVYPDLDALNLTEDQKTVFKMAYEDLIVISLNHMKALKKAGIKNDVMKYLVVEGLRTNFVWTINLRALRNFLDLRKSDKAHFEIRHVANLILESLKDTWIAGCLEKYYSFAEQLQKDNPRHEVV